MPFKISWNNQRGSNSNFSPEAVGFRGLATISFCTVVLIRRYILMVICDKLVNLSQYLCIEQKY